MKETKEKETILREFVASLSDSDAREQLVRAYLQMERCQEVMEGKDVEPVEMMENGLDSDLELFYMCKKLYNESNVSTTLHVNAGHGLFGWLRRRNSEIIIKLVR